MLKQYHSNKIINFDNFLVKKRYKADGIITSYPNFSFGILTADCVPDLYRICQIWNNSDWF